MDDTPTPRIIRASPSLEAEVSRMFSEISHSGDSATFHPHEFTPDHARKICTYEGLDQYFLAMADGRAVGYGMLRGWDEGFDIPSVGLWVSSEFRSRGLGRRLLVHLQTQARLASAPSVRLTVTEGNEPALHLYKGAGYVFEGVDGEGKLVGYLHF